jgi:hypothetical protein
VNSQQLEQERYNRDAERSHLRSLEKQIRQRRYKSQRTEGLEKRAQEIRNKWLFF